MQQVNNWNENSVYLILESTNVFSSKPPVQRRHSFPPVIWLSQVKVKSSYLKVSREAQISYVLLILI